MKTNAICTIILTTLTLQMCCTASHAQNLENTPINTKTEKREQKYITSWRWPLPVPDEAQTTAYKVTPEMMFTDSQTVDFVYAILDDNIKAMEGLLKKGANVNAIGYCGITPLFCAFDSSEECFHWLLDNGANPNCGSKAKSGKEIGPIIYSAIDIGWHQQGSLSRLRLLLEHGANPDIACDSLGDYSPMLSVFCNPSLCRRYEIEPLELLLKAGAKVNPDRINYLFYCGTYTQVLFLLENGADEKRSGGMIYGCKEERSFVDKFTLSHRSMDGFSKKEFWDDVNRKIGFATPGIYSREEYYNIALKQWDNYWKIVELLNKKGYNLKTESEAAKSERSKQIPAVINEYRIL